MAAGAKFFNKTPRFARPKPHSTLKYQWSSLLSKAKTLWVPPPVCGGGYQIEYFSRTDNSLIEHFHIPIYEERRGPPFLSRSA